MLFGPGSDSKSGLLQNIIERVSDGATRHLPISGKERVQASSCPSRDASDMLSGPDHQRCSGKCALRLRGLAMILTVPLGDACCCHVQECGRKFKGARITKLVSRNPGNESRTFWQHVKLPLVTGLYRKHFFCGDLEIVIYIYITYI